MGVGTGTASRVAGTGVPRAGCPISCLPHRLPCGAGCLPRTCPARPFAPVWAVSPAGTHLDSGPPRLEAAAAAAAGSVSPGGDGVGSRRTHPEDGQEGGGFAPGNGALRGCGGCRCFGQGRGRGAGLAAAFPARPAALPCPRGPWLPAKACEQQANRGEGTGSRGFVK